MVLISHKNFNPKYGSYIFSINSFQKHLKKICYGLMELRESLNKIEFFVEKLPVPILHEQQLIVEFLDSKMELIDMLISTKERKISLLKEQRTSLINQVVTKGLNDNVKMKDSGVEWIGKIPIDWISSKIKHQFMFKGGGTPSTENELYWDGNILWVSPKDMKSKYITDTQDKISQLGLENSSSNLIPPGTLLIVVRSGILQRTIPVSINKTEVSLNQDVKSIQSKGNVLIEFLYYFIKGNENNLLLEWSKVGCTVESIEMEYLNNFQFHFPNLKEQYQIIEHLDLKTKEMDDLIQLEQKKIDLLKEYRQSLISEVVTGKIKVTTDE
jgi:type I restriction enzyme S subunit